MIPDPDGPPAYVAPAVVGRTPVDASLVGVLVFSSDALPCAAFTPVPPAP